MLLAVLVALLVGVTGTGICITTMRAEAEAATIPATVTGITTMGTGAVIAALAHEAIVGRPSR